MEQIPAAIVASLTTLLAVFGGWLTARRYAKMGGGPAQQALNSTLKQTIDAQGAELTSLRRQLDDAQTDLLELHHDFKVCKVQLQELQQYVAQHVVRGTDPAPFTVRDPVREPRGDA